MNNKNLFTIGEFSKITGLTVKTLRHYHDIKILVPIHIDSESDYRYYNNSQIEKAKAITLLKNLNLTLPEISEVLSKYSDDSQMLVFFEKHVSEILQKIKELNKTSKTINELIKKEREAEMILSKSQFNVEEKNIESVLVASIRYEGKYSECGKYFGAIGKSFGRFINGKAFNLYYDLEFKADNADIESCMPIKKGKSSSEIQVKELAGGKGVSLIYKGPYDQIGNSYAIIFNYIKSKNYEIIAPIREIYIKGPGMIFKGNPKNYLTEIIVLVK